MTKKLYIVRHAKSDWAHSDVLKDIDRPLNTRGVRNAYEMSARFLAKGIKADVILASNGIRALHTAIIFARQMNLDSSIIKVIPELYHSSASEILNVLKNVSSEHEKVMLFAHNPGISDFASYVNKDSYLHVPTCATLDIEVEAINWSNISFESLKLIKFDFPKNKKAS